MSDTHEIEHIFHLRKAVTIMRNRDRSFFQQRMYDEIRNALDGLEYDLFKRGIDVDALLAARKQT